MYSTDVPRIAKHGLRDSTGLIDVITFALCTIQQPLQSCGAQMRDIRKVGDKSHYLWGMKRDGYRYAVAHAPVLLAGCKAAVSSNDTIGALDLLCNVPGLGIVKAGFVAQMLGLDVACLDRHNLDMLGMPRSALRFSKAVTRETRLNKISDYVSLCAEQGAEYWWDSWCEYVAGQRYNVLLPTAQQTSEYHVKCICV